MIDIKMPSLIKIIISVVAILNIYKFIVLDNASIFNQMVALFALLVPVFVFKMINWSDRFNLGFSNLYPWAFLLGFGVVSNIALVFNESFSLLTGDITTIALGAPIIEELLKAFFVILFIKITYKAPITTIGVASVGALIGAGFALTEDLLYIYSSTEPLNQALIRMLFAPFFHATTAMLYGIFYFKNKRDNYFFLIILFNIMFHIAWNVSSLIYASTLFIALLSLSVTLTFLSIFLFLGEGVKIEKVSNLSSDELLELTNHLQSNKNVFEERGIEDIIRINYIRELVNKIEEKKDVNQLGYFHKLLFEVEKIDEKENKLDIISKDEIKNNP